MLKEKDLLATCTSCKRVSKVTFETKQLDNDIDEVGLRCPVCDYWQPSYWLNRSLKDKQIQGASRKLKREYEREFVKFQKKMKANLKNHQSLKVD